MDSVFSFLAEHFDLPILDWIAGNLRCGFLDGIMPLITTLGDAGIFWILVALALIVFPKYRKVGITIGASMLIGLLVCNVTMKPLFARPRPYDYQLAHFGKTIELIIAAQHDFSFPSGHTIASFEAATVLFMYNKKFGIPAMILACLIAFSRLYLYVHYPTDVLCSVVLGIAIAFLADRLVKMAFRFYQARKSAH